MIKHFLIALLSSLILTACIDEYPVDLPFDEPQLVVDALISSQPGDSFITLGWTFPGEVYYDEVFNFPVRCAEDEISEEIFLVSGKISIREEPNTIYESPIQIHDRKSHITFNISTITGTPGSKYYLDIEVTYDDKTSSYSSETLMLQTPEITDMNYEIRKSDIGKRDNFVPLISFHESQSQKNFYLFKLCELYGDEVYCNKSRSWPYSIISDAFLPEYVNGLSIDDGASVAKYIEFYPSVYTGVGAQVKMYSTTSETYQFYKVLLAQFDNDGGAYTSVPANPPGNINGGAIGLFRALHETSGKVYY